MLTNVWTGDIIYNVPHDIGAKHKILENDTEKEKKKKKEQSDSERVKRSD